MEIRGGKGVSKKILHFSIGPVQDFITQSRKTRDLLASSFLLSFLSGHAMVSIIQNGGRIIFPYVQGENEHNIETSINDPLLLAIYQTKTKKSIEKGPHIGSLPNRFKAEVPIDFDPKVHCVRAVKQAWKRVADAVWDHFIAEVAPQGKNTKEIWNRQIGSYEMDDSPFYWDISWVIGEQNYLLNRRKNWRSYIPTEEPGDKCMLFGNMQEISGYIHTERDRNGSKQKQFWTSLRKSTSKRDSTTYELREGEKLSAIALVKRFYPLVAEEALGWKLPTEAVRFPSTADLAIRPWREEVLKTHNDKAIAFMKHVMKIKLSAIGIHDDEINKSYDEERLVSEFKHLEGPFFYSSNLSNERFWQEKGFDVDSCQVEELIELLSNIENSYRKPSPFYALLVMDGDQLGNLLQSTNMSDPGRWVSHSLASFTKDLEGIVKCHGETVYAGGDDVLALLTLDGALSVANNLHMKYKEAFQAHSSHSHNQATISAAIVYTHYKAPLQGVLKYAHYLLDDVAKDAKGRDSLAIGVWKTGGPVLEWAAPWQIIQGSGDATIIEQLALEFKGKGEDVASSSFLYKLREHYDRIGRFSGNPEENKEIFRKLLVAEYLKSESRENEFEMNHQVEKRIETLVNLCLSSWRDQDHTLHYAEGDFRSDGALLVRFLAKKGEENS